MTTTYDANSLPEPVRREREKWDAYYEAHPDEPENPVIQASGEELATHMAALLPDGARILEAGSGAGWQSLALARLGRFEVHLMDFSAPALRSARRIFERAGQKAEFHLDDVFRKDQPQYDLVFNAGVLEHYTFEQQAAFLAGMASRSRGYVLALVPNNLCYWY
jgi:2-polyprenyl-3-methyl-5-hydroxy-6-metoxy-1,4-benzoquinol methylase